MIFFFSEEKTKRVYESEIKRNGGKKKNVKPVAYHGLNNLCSLKPRGIKILMTGEIGVRCVVSKLVKFFCETKKKFLTFVLFISMR